MYQNSILKLDITFPPLKLAGNGYILLLLG
jgi:hypothetical protein